MKMIDINNDKRLYNPAERNVTCNRSGCPEMAESELYRRIGKALVLHESLGLAITDMRALLAGG
jgi:hypothetical protein